jgi:hypothetical protein
VLENSSARTFLAAHTVMGSMMEESHKLAKMPSAKFVKPHVAAVALGKN